VTDIKKRRHHKSKHKHKHSQSKRCQLVGSKLRSERLAREQESRRRVQSLIVSERLSASVVNANCDTSMIWTALSTLDLLESHIGAIGTTAAVHGHKRHRAAGARLCEAGRD
jgi:hypothetical protein